MSRFTAYRTWRIPAMTINQPNDAPDRLVFSCSGIFRSMEILTDTDDYPYPTLAVRIHITLANDTVFTFRHVSALKSAMAEAWCCELLISRFGTFNHLRPRECSDALSVLQPFSSNPGISPYCLPPDTSGTV